MGASADTTAYTAIAASNDTSIDVSSNICAHNTAVCSNASARSHICPNIWRMQGLVHTRKGGTMYTSKVCQVQRVRSSSRARARAKTSARFNGCFGIGRVHGLVHTREGGSMYTSK